MHTLKWQIDNISKPYCYFLANELLGFPYTISIMNADNISVHKLVNNCRVNFINQSYQRQHSVYRIILLHKYLYDGDTAKLKELLKVPGFTLVAVRNN